MNPLQRAILVLITGLLGGLFAQAQTVKRIEVDSSHPYADHVALSDETKEADLIVKIIFDESQNRLIVSLISYRKLFVFQEPTGYAQAVRCRELCPCKLPYVVAYEPGVRYKLSKELLRTLPSPRKRALFGRWITYTGLQPQPTDFRMVNDYIEQSFDIINQGNSVTFTLYDLFLLDEEVKHGRKTYHLLPGKNLNRTYEITLHRNPCLGKEEEMNAITQSVQSIEAAYLAIQKRYGTSPELLSQESADNFNELKGLLLKQYPSQTRTSPCSDVQNNIKAYNDWVEAIEKLSYHHQPKSERMEQTLHPDYVLIMARRIDNNVARWKLTSDKAEKGDLVQACNNILSEVDPLLKACTTTSEELRMAIAIFRRAEQFFNQVCRE